MDWQRSHNDDRPTAQRVPLSIAQESFWLLSKGARTHGAFNVYRAWRLGGQLDVEALQWALRQVADRHDILRTRIEVLADAAYQVYDCDLALALDIVDLSVGSTEPGIAEALGKEIVAARARRDFDLQTGPLANATLVRLSQRDHLLLIALHHIIGDASSMRVFLNELSTFYLTAVKRKCVEAPMLERPMQYREFAERQRHLLNEPAFAGKSRYWQTQLIDAPAAVELPITGGTKPANSASTPVGAAEHGCLPDTAIARLAAWAKNEYGMTQSMACFAAYVVVLALQSGQRDFVVGLPVQGRTRREMKTIIGPLVNPLAIRIRLATDPTIDELFRTVRKALLEAYKHHEFPIEKAIRDIKADRSITWRMPFNVFFNFYEFNPAALLLDELTVEQVELDAKAAKFDLSLIVRALDSTVMYWMEYDPVRFDKDYVQGIAAQYERTVVGLPEWSSRKLSEIDLVTQDVRETLLVKINATTLPYPQDKCAWRLFSERAGVQPDVPAVLCDGEVLSYGDLERQSNQLAHLLRDAGCGPEIVVGLCMTRSAQCIVALLAILKTGAVYFPLDPLLPRARLQQMLHDANPAVVLVQTQTAHLVESEAMAVVDVTTQRKAISQCSIQPLNVRSALDHLAYLIYTSGSTGEPKGVMATQRGLANRLASQGAIAPFKPGDVGCQKTSLAFVDSVVEILAPLVSGATLTIATDDIRADAVRFMELLVQYGVSHLLTVPAVAAALVRELDGFRQKLSLRYWTLSGEAVPDSLRAELCAILPGCKFINVYGSSEVAADATFAALDGAMETRVAIGSPLSNVVAYVLDEAMRLVPIGTRGELYIGGHGVARGYWQRPGLTADRFMPSPFCQGERLYRTGDFARWRSDHALEYLGRCDRQVKIRGQRVELDEVEALLGGHPSVGETAVTSCDDARVGRQVVACAVMHKGCEVKATDLRIYLASRLPEAALPSRIVFLDALPRTQSGKVDYKALLAVLSGMSDFQEQDMPITAIEKNLLAIWRDVLRLKHVGICDSFSDLGGHSLLGMQILTRIRNEFGVDLPLRVLLAPGSDIRSVASLVTSASTENSSSPTLDAKPRPLRLPLSLAQERVWFLQQLYPANAAFHEALAFRLRGALDVRVLEQSLAALIVRHESLRTRFVVVDGQPCQIVEPEREFGLTVVDAVPSETEGGYGTAVQRMIAAEMMLPFDLEAGPPFRVRLLRLTHAEYVLVVVMHHIICDGWSLRNVLPRDLSALYIACLTNSVPELPALKVQYADFAVWQREWLRDDVLARHLDYWKAQLAGMPPMVDLPTDHVRPPRPSFRGSRVPVSVSTPSLRLLSTIAQREGATLFIVLLAAFQLLLSKWSGQRDIVVASPIAGRTHAETHGLLGLFMNTLILRTHIRGELTFASLVRNVKETALGAYEHEAVPFEKLVQELELEQDLSRNPLFQVMFALQNLQRSAVAMPGIEVDPLMLPRRTAKIDLFLQMSETPDGLEGSIEYASDLFEQSTIERFSKQFSTLIEEICNGPDLPLADLSPMTVEERAQIITEWSGNHSAGAGSSTIHSLFVEQASRTPDAIALTANGEKLTYGELDRHSNRFAHYLLKAGIGPEQVVLVCLERSFDSVVALIGIMKAGAAYMPLDRHFPVERMRYAIEQAGDPWLVTRAELLDMLPKGRRRPILVDVDRTEIECQPADPVPMAVHPDNLAYLLLTSGSTGWPKCVAGVHRAVVNRLQWNGGTPDERYVHRTTPIFIDALWELFMPLTRGQTVVIIGDDDAQQVPALVSTLAAQRVTRMAIVPSLLNLILDEETCLGDKLPTLGHVTCGGEPMTADLAAKFARQCPNATLVNAYGLSEVWDVCDWVADLNASEGAALIGRPIPNVRVFILDGYCEPVPEGQWGELYVGGAGIARGYWRRPSLTAERFVPSPFGVGERLYRTGDIVRWRSDGQIEYLGRADQQVKMNARRIEIAEIERVLLSHKSVRNASVIARCDTAQEPRLIAYVSARERAIETDEVALREHLRLFLPEYMVPAAIVFLDRLPLTPSGKVDRRQLPPPAQRTASPDYAAPGTQTEIIVEQIWSEVLGIERVGLNSAFFALGGDSLQAMRAVARTGDRFSIQVPLRVLFERPTVKAFCEWVDTMIATTGDSISQDGELGNPRAS